MAEIHLVVTVGDQLGLGLVAHACPPLRRPEVVHGHVIADRVSDLRAGELQLGAARLDVHRAGLVAGLVGVVRLGLVAGLLGVVRHSFLIPSTERRPSRRVPSTPRRHSCSVCPTPPRSQRLSPNPARSRCRRAISAMVALYISQPQPPSVAPDQHAGVVLADRRRVIGQHRRHPVSGDLILKGTRWRGPYVQSPVQRRFR